MAWELPTFQSMKLPYARSVAITLLLATFILGQSPAGASPSADEACDKLYADYLGKAKQALMDKKPDDAVAFLLKASAVAESCASVERTPEGQGKEKTLALARWDTSLYR